MKQQITINLTEEEAMFLKQYSDVFSSEEKIHGTRDPLHIVQTMRRKSINGECCDSSDIDSIEFVIYARAKRTHQECSKITELRFDNHDDMRVAAIDWIKSNHVYSDRAEDYFNETDDDYCSEIVFESKNGLASLTIERLYFSEFYTNVAYFLTKKEALQYISDQRHNLSKPRVYTACMSGHRSKDGDLASLSKLLLRMGKNL